MTQHQSPFNLAVLAAGLGFFIDAFDLFLFNVYRIPSLKELGLSGTELTRQGEFLLSVQMLGMMVGGVLTGIIADKRGRLTALYGSIVLYSLANIANGMVQDVHTYALIRFLAGVGLAGELGAGITLVGESMTIEKRGYGTILVATLGGLGAVTAGIAGDVLPWRQAFVVSGIAGFLLLLLRLRTLEPSVFTESRRSGSAKGSFRLLFASRRRAAKYLACIAMGVPIWYSVGLLITLSPELAELHHIEGLKLTTCFILFQVGIASGDLSSGLLSQWMRSRKRVLIAFMLLALGSTVFHFFNLYQSQGLAWSSLLMGWGCGYLSVFATSTAEHFGTNLRVTVTATVTNFMRGAVVLLIPFHQWIESIYGLTLTGGLLVTGLLVWALAWAAVLWLPDTYGRDLRFEEQ